jgi:hypothetical protein
MLAQTGSGTGVVAQTSAFEVCGSSVGKLINFKYGVCAVLSLSPGYIRSICALRTADLKNGGPRYRVGATLAPVRKSRMAAIGGVANWPSALFDRLQIGHFGMLFMNFHSFL